MKTHPGVVAVADEVAPTACRSCCMKASSMLNAAAGGGGGSAMDGATKVARMGEVE